jgi:hypothetical protein
MVDWEWRWAMIVFQNDDPNGESSLVIVIEQDNLIRMQKGDPITLKSKRLSGILEPVHHPAHLRVIVAYEQDSGRAYEFLQRQDKTGLMRYLMRGLELTALDGTRGKTGTA